MSNYKCDTCEKVFNRKYNFDRHKNRKIPCKFSTKKGTQKSTKIHQNTPKSTEIYKCNYCQNEFSRSDSLNRHLKTRCKVKIQSELEKEAIFQDLLKKVEQLEHQLESKNLELTINNTINNNSTNNIKLVAFGKEDMSFVVKEVTQKILGFGFQSIPIFTKYLHFNNNKPEYHNIYISNMKNKFVMVYDGDKWNLTNDDILGKLIDFKTDFLAEKFDEYQDDLPEPTLRKFARFLNEQYEDDVINEIKDELKLILYNNRNLPLETKQQLGLI